MTVKSPIEIERPLSRRSFFKSTAVAAASVSTLNPGRLAHAAGSDLIRVGLIGVGDRGSQLMKELLAAREKCNAQITAVCDVWKVNREAAAARVKQASGCEPKSFARFGDLLASCRFSEPGARSRACEGPRRPDRHATAQRGPFPRGGEVRFDGRARDHQSHQRRHERKRRALGAPV
jgi:hypothetical protein